MRRIGHAVARLAWVLALAAPAPALAGAQAYEPLSASVQAALHKAISDHAVPYLAFATEGEARRWLTAMSKRLARRMPDRSAREEFLVTVHYEAKRAGLDPQLVLGLIQVESNFRKYAVSGAGARGYMQVMPFWVKLIGNGEHNLFHLRTNLRYGSVILRHYLDRENGDLYRALGRYNGSLGRAEYPSMVVRAWQRNWHYTLQTAEDAGSERRGSSRGRGEIKKNLLLFAFQTRHETRGATGMEFPIPLLDAFGGRKVRSSEREFHLAASH